MMFFLQSLFWNMSLFFDVGQSNEIIMTQEVAASVDPAIICLECLIAVKAIMAFILCLPLPSNAVRGAITGCLNTTTDKFPQIKQFTIVLAVVEAVYLFFAIRSLSFMDGPITGCSEQMELFRQERNAYLTGFGLFTTMVITRVYRLQSQLFEARKVAKKAESKSS